MADREWYHARLLTESRRIYDTIRTWAENRGRGVTIIGGWAVYERVDPVVAQQSRDLDLILHDQDAVDDFGARLDDWDLTWGRSDKGVPKAARRKRDKEREILVDVFTAQPMARPFGGHAFENVKDPKGQGLHADLAFLLVDKLRTVPLRQGRDVYLKQAKDLVDLYHLVFHNRDRWPPLATRKLTTRPERLAARRYVRPARRRYPEYAEEYGDLDDWLTD